MRKIMRNTEVDAEGKLITIEKKRGPKMGLKALESKYKKQRDDSYGNRVYIVHGDCEEYADEVENMIKKENPNADVTKMMPDDEIIAEVKKYPAVTVVLTGGEPSLWIDDELIDRLHQAGKYVTIETNGTRPLPAAIDWVTCSPKQGAKLAIDRMDEVKVVYEGQDISIFELLPAEHFFLQPCSCNNTASTVDCVMRHPKWRLSLQTHKLIDIR